MDTYISFVTCVTCAVFVLCGAGMQKSNITITVVSKNVTVFCGETFTLCCNASSNATFVWSRSGTVVKHNDTRYLHKTKMANDSINFCIIVTEAANLDKGDWTCLIQATDNYHGAKSDNISVNVLPSNNGAHCSNTSNEFKNKAENSPTSSPSDGLNNSMMLYLYIGVGASCTIIVILISIIVYIQCGKRKTKTEQPRERPVPLNVINGPTSNNGPPMSDVNNIYQNLVETSKTEKRFFIDVEDKQGDTSPAEVIYSQVVLSRVGSTVRPSQFETTEYASVRIKRNSVSYN